MPWKVSLALMTPPTRILSGWLTLTFTLLCVGLLSALLIEFARLFSCASNFGVLTASNLIVAPLLSMPNIIATYQAAKSINLKSADDLLKSPFSAIGVGLSTSFGLFFFISNLGDAVFQSPIRHGLPES